MGAEIEGVRAEAMTAFGLPAWISPAMAKRAIPDPLPARRDMKLPFYKEMSVSDGDSR